MAELIQKLKRAAADPGYYYAALMLKYFGKRLPDRTALRMLFRVKMGRRLNLKNPQTFCEKIQWLKLYDCRPRYTVLADKYLAKEAVGEILGKEHVVPLLGVWEKAADIDFDALPDRFVLKCNHDSHSWVICRDKSSLDREAVRQELQQKLDRDFSELGRETVYRGIPRRIIAEEYLEDPEDTSGFTGLTDYKFFCMGGVPKVMFISHDIDAMAYFDMYDMNFEHLDVLDEWKDPNPPAKPVCFDEMRRAAEKLSQGIPFVRVDFYQVGGQYYFGEMTFYPMAGFVPFGDSEWDRLLGAWIELPKKR